MNVFSTLKKAAAVLCIACISVMAAEPLIYTIVGSGEQLTARVGDPREGEVVGTANRPIREVINAIRDHAKGEDCTIQFGVNDNLLSIGGIYHNNQIIFDGGDFGDAWGKITLRGRITAHTDGWDGTIVLRNGVSIESFADIANTAHTWSQIVAIQNSGSGTLTISGGEITGVGTDNSHVVRNSSSGTIIIKSGTITALMSSNYAIRSSGSGNIVISGDAVITASGDGNAKAASGSALASL